MLTVVVDLSFETKEEALAYLDECNRPRPHTELTYEQAMAVDDTLEVPVGWDTQLLGPWAYNPRQRQEFPRPYQFPLPPQPLPTTQSRLQQPSRISRAEQLRAIIRQGRIPPPGSNNGGAFDTVDPATYLRACFPALESACKFDPSLADEAARLINEHLPALQRAFSLDSSLQAALSPNGPSPATDDVARDTQPDPFPLTHAVPQGIPLDLPPWYYKDRTAETDTLSVDDCKSGSVHKVDQPHEVAKEDRGAYRGEASSSASAPSSQITSEAVFTPPSSAARRPLSDVDDEDELPSKKARLLDPVLQPEILTCVTPEDHLPSDVESELDDDSLEYDVVVESVDESDSNDVVKIEDDSNLNDYAEPDSDHDSVYSMATWRLRRHSETKRYTRCNQAQCRREFVTLLARSDGVDIDISGDKAAPLTDAIAQGIVPQPFNGQSLTRQARRQVTGAIDALFNYYSTVVVRSEREVDLRYLSD
ncbi:unnamed protein product [Fusarium equiseti]|uniref:Uncharacterized protein n=1 Tax=Fusarium equiseti TaxID=61235 RepID=A0A8J2NKQ7_FUSEQ|nr:unnamed protein product [Fusarium equiseti]